jgi:hypothetical protein
MRGEAELTWLASNKNPAQAEQARAGTLPRETGASQLQCTYHVMLMA